LSVFKKNDNLPRRRDESFAGGGAALSGRDSQLVDIGQLPAKNRPLFSGLWMRAQKS